MKPHKGLVFRAIVCIPFAALALPVNAQITTDGSVGAAITLSGPSIEISQSLGSLRGDNLFHSFQTFDIPASTIATFTGSDQVSNVISRVTGGAASDIQGTLASTISNADFYFINPAGVVLGPNSTVDVPASFHLGTAQQIKFSDGTLFHSDAVTPSTLSIAPPEAFGFTGSDQAAIEIQGAQLAFGAGSRVLLAGNQLSMEQASSLQVVNEQVTLIAAGELAIGEITSIDFGGDPPGSVSGELIIDDSSINSFGSGPTAIAIHGGNIQISASAVQQVNLSATDSDAGITVSAEELHILNGATVQTATAGQGSGGFLHVETDQLLITDDGALTARTVSDGRSGNISVTTTGQLTINDGGQIRIEADANGEAGVVSVNAGDLSISGNQLEGVFAGISNVANDIGASGNIEIEIIGDLSITDGGSISSSAGSIGNSGSITVQANQIDIESFGSGFLTGIFSSAEGVGKGGDVSVSANGQLSLTGGALIANTVRTGQNQGDSGTVFVNAARLVIVADEDSLPAGVFSEASSTGNGGDIVIDASEEIILRNGGEISAVTVNSGSAGTITINTGQLLIDSSSRISSESRNSTAGEGGDIEIRAIGQLTILNGGEINASTNSDNDAGSIIISVEQLLLDSQDSAIATGITSSTSGGGKAGNVAIEVAELATIKNSGQISTDSNTFAEGNAGDVQLTAGELFIDRQGNQQGITGISSSTSGPGNAGRLEVTIADTATIQNGGEILSSTFADGDAGEVILNTGQLLIDGQDSVIVTGISSDTFASGNAGRVEVNVEEVATLLSGGDVSSETFGAGDAGFVRLTAGQLLIDSQESRLFTGISSSTFDTGQAGSVDLVIAESASLLNGGRISSATSGAGDGGDVQLTADQLLIEGGDNSIDISGIFSDTLGGGNAGKVELTIAGLARIQNGGRISTSTAGSPNAGEVLLTTGELALAGEGIRSGRVTSSTSGAGNAGRVVVNIAETAAIKNEAFISSDSTGEGDAGIVQVTAGQLLIDGRENTLESGSITAISSQSFGVNAQTIAGNAGSVEVLVDGTIELLDAQISSAASGGAAGSVRVAAERLIVEGDGRDINLVPGIFTSSNARQAGPVMVNTNALILANSQISTSTGSSILDGGNVSIVSEVTVLDSALIQANANSGQGGIIDIDSALIGSGNQIDIGGVDRVDFQFDSLNVIQAVAPSGVSVPPTINAPDIDVSGSLTELNTAFDVAADLLSDPCATFVTGAPSTLSLAGKGGLPTTLASVSPFELPNRPAIESDRDIKTGTRVKRANYDVASISVRSTTESPCVSSVE